jgi:protocatechuate 3,4-dioxygenase alpha subunit
MPDGITPSQTVGPFFAIGLPWPEGPFAVDADEPGAIWIRGQVYDGAGDLVPDALLETWQSSPEATALFRGFTRCGTDAEGRYAIRTLKPGPVPGPDGTVQAPHLGVSVFARGLLDRVVTRIYFADEASNVDDPVLGAAGPGAATLIATAGEDGYVFDIRLQGPDETVFLAI